MTPEKPRYNEIDYTCQQCGRTWTWWHDKPDGKPFYSVEEMSKACQKCLPTGPVPEAPR